jgi:hypothetical protein
MSALTSTSEYGFLFPASRAPALPPPPKKKFRQATKKNAANIWTGDILPGNETAGPREEGSKNIHLECQFPYFLRRTFSHKHCKCCLLFSFFFLFQNNPNDTFVSHLRI